MKTLTLLLLLISFTNLSGQINYSFKKDETGNVYFEEIIEVLDLSKNDLFIKGKEWFALEKWSKGRKKEKGFWMDNEKRDHGQILVSFEDKEEGKIFGSGRTNILVYKNTGMKKNGGSFIYTITTLFKDGKTRIIIDNLKFEGGDMMGVNSGALIDEDYPKVFGKFGKSQIQKQWNLMREQAIKEFEEIIKDYKEFMFKKDIKLKDW